MSAKSRKREPSAKPTRRRKKLTLKRAAKTLAKAIYRHLIELPEREREQHIAHLERTLAKKLKRLRSKK